MVEDKVRELTSSQAQSEDLRHQVDMLQGKIQVQEEERAQMI